MHTFAVLLQRRQLVELLQLLLQLVSYRRLKFILKFGLLDTEKRAVALIHCQMVDAVHLIAELERKLGRCIATAVLVVELKRIPQQPNATVRFRQTNRLPESRLELGGCVKREKTPRVIQVDWRRERDDGQSRRDLEGGQIESWC